MNRSILLYCPFCGNTPEIYQDTSSDYKKDWGWSLECDGCGVQLKNFISKEELEKRWNSRINL